MCIAYRFSLTVNPASVTLTADDKSSTVKLLFNVFILFAKPLFKVKKGCDLMADKIKLRNGLIFELVPDGIKPYDKTRKITITSDLTYAEIESCFANTDNISTIQYLSEADEVLKTYADCVSLKTLYKDYDNGTYTVELSIDAVAKQLNELAQGQTNAELALVEVYELLLGVMMNG